MPKLGGARMEKETRTVVTFLGFTQVSGANSKGHFVVCCGWRRFLIGIASNDYPTSLRNHYRHQFGIGIAIARNPHTSCVTYQDARESPLKIASVVLGNWISARLRRRK